MKEAKRLRKRYASFEGDLAQLFSELTANPSSVQTSVAVSAK